MAFFKKSGVSLSQFVRGIVKALTDGQQAIPHSREEQLNCHMEKTVAEDGSEIFKPKMISVLLEDGRMIRVPRYTLAQVNTIGIHSARVRCSARIVDMERASDCGSMTCGEHHAIFTVNPTLDGKASFEIEIEFQQREPSESESRMMESLDSLVVEKTSP